MDEQLQQFVKELEGKYGKEKVESESQRVRELSSLKEHWQEFVQGKEWMPEVLRVAMKRAFYSGAVAAAVVVGQNQPEKLLKEFVAYYQEMKEEGDGKQG